MIETLEQLDTVIFALAGIVIASILAFAYMYTKEGSQLPEQVAQKQRTLMDRVDYAIFWLKVKYIELSVGVFGSLAVVITLGFDTPLSSSVERNIMYIGLGMLAAAIITPWVYSQIRTRNVEFLHAKNPKDRLLTIHELTPRQFEELMLVEPYKDDKGNLNFKRLALTDLEDVRIKTSWGIERGYACYRFYEDELVAIASRRSNMTPEEEEEYEDALDYLDAYDAQVREDFRRLRNGFERLVDEETDHRVNEFLHDFQNVAFEEERTFSERIDNSVESALMEILDEPVSERLGIEHPRETHDKADLLEAFEKSEGAISDFLSDEGDSE